MSKPEIPDLSNAQLNALIDETLKVLEETRRERDVAMRLAADTAKSLLNEQRKRVKSLTQLRELYDAVCKNGHAPFNSQCPLCEQLTKTYKFLENKND